MQTTCVERGHETRRDIDDDDDDDDDDDANQTIWVALLGRNEIYRITTIRHPRSLKVSTLQCF